MSGAWTQRHPAPMHLWPEGVREEGGAATVACAIECEGFARERLWYRVPVELRPWLVESCDPFVVACTLSAMRRGADLVAHGEASPSLLANLVEFQNVWMNWGGGRYRPVEMRADAERERPAAEPSAPAVCAFTGGVDSAFSVRRHRKGLAGRATRDVQAGLFVHGFDIPLEQEAAYARAAASAEATLASVGVRLVRMATNHKRLNPEWNDTHGVAIASCLMLLGGRFGHGLIPATHGYAELPPPWGSHPLADPWLSSASFRIVHDGGAWARYFKLREVAAWPEAFERLRVCWRATSKDENCGRCAKCVLTLLALRDQGLGVPPSFPADPDERAILRLRLDPGEAAFAAALLDGVRERRAGEPWVRALERCVRWNARERALAQPAGGRLAGAWRRVRLAWHRRAGP
jgi:hypothetical protein